MKKLLMLLGTAVLLISCGTAAVESSEPVYDQQVDDLEGIVSTTTDLQSLDCEIIYSDLTGSEVYYRRACNTAFRSEISPDSRFLIYVDDYKIMLFDEATGEVIELMSVLDDTDGVSFFWSPDSRTIAMAVANMSNESYDESFGTKLYVLEIGENSELVRKDRYLYKMAYGCHDAGCNVTAEDLYFVDEDTLMYRTWENDPYSAEGDDSMLRMVDL